MFGGLVRHFFLRILGIDQPKGYGGYREKLLLAPVFPQGLESARGYVGTPHGRVTVDWHRGAEGIVYRATVPVGLSATLSYAGRTVTLHPGSNTVIL